MVNPYDIAVRLADRLIKVTPGDFPNKVLFINSGAEAVENAIKIARYYTKKSGIVVFDGAYHGRTYLTMTMTAKVKPYKLGFGPFVPEIYRAPFGDIEALKEFFITGIDTDNIAAIIVEPVLGEGGFIVPPDDFYPQLAELCKEHGILFIADEIQTGFGRTGKMFAMENLGVTPDLMTTAKSLAAGMPLSAVIGRAEIMDSVHAGGLGGTYGANPVSCAAAHAVLDIFEEENILEKAQKLGDTLTDKFTSWKDRKGMEPAGYDPRVLKCMGLTFGTAPRGACHLRTTFYKPELSGMIPPDQIEGKAEMLVDYEDRLNIFDTLTLCRFYRGLYTWEELEKTIQMVTGEKTTQESLRARAAHVARMTRKFNIKEGFTAADDRLPKRLHKEVLPEGDSLSEVEMEYMLQDYYRLRGWDREGIPVTD